MSASLPDTGAPMADDATYRQSDLDRYSKLIAWVVAGIMAVVAVTGAWYTVQRRIENVEEGLKEERSARERESARTTAIETTLSVNNATLSEIKGSVDAVLAILQGGTGENSRPSSASRR